MSNFSPKIEDMSESELRNAINEYSSDWALIASNEVTKRSLDSLHDTITVFNKQSSEQTEKMLFLTYLMAFCTVIMLVVGLIQIYIALK